MFIKKKAITQHAIRKLQNNLILKLKKIFIFKMNAQYKKVSNELLTDITNITNLRKLK